MAFRYGLPIFLEDQTGRLTRTGSDYVDLYNRKSICYQRISHACDFMRTTYGVFDRNSVSCEPDITLEFGADNSLGTIKVPVGHSDAIAMDIYLPRVSLFARCNFLFSV
jgi:hypothetical protein